MIDLADDLSKKFSVNWSYLGLISSQVDLNGSVLKEAAFAVAMYFALDDGFSFDGYVLKDHAVLNMITAYTEAPRERAR